MQKQQILHLHVLLPQLIPLKRTNLHIKYYYYYYYKYCYYYIFYTDNSDGVEHSGISKETISSPTPSDAKKKEKDTASSTLTNVEHTASKAGSDTDICLSPLEKFRPGYLWVTDLTRQIWCEQQLYYSFTVPCVEVENPAMTAGTDLHLARGTGSYITLLLCPVYGWRSGQ
jgi:hypothetical protein